jgi:cell division protein FtsA
MTEGNKIVVGLDIGTTKVCSIAGKKNIHNQPEVIGVGYATSEGLVMGTVINIDKTILAIKKSIEDLESKAGINVGVVNVGIAGKHIKTSIHTGSITRENIDQEITTDDVNRLTNDMYKTVTPAGTSIIHVMPQEYAIDSRNGIKDPVGMSGIKLEGKFQIITADTNSINNIYKSVKRVGLEIENLILEPLASSISVLSEEEKEAGVCLVDIGGGTTDIAIFHKSILKHTAIVPLGSKIITDDIKQGCMVLESQAEKLKIKFGKAISEQAYINEIVNIPGLKNRHPRKISVNVLAKIIEARLEEIIELVYAEIISSGLHGKLAAGIVITGGGAQLQFLTQLFEYITGYDTRLGLPNEHINNTELEIVKSPVYSTAIGLMLAGFDEIEYRDDKYKSNSNTFRANNKEEKSFGFFRKILNKTKSLLIEDYHDRDTL